MLSFRGRLPTRRGSERKLAEVPRDTGGARNSCLNDSRMTQPGVLRLLSVVNSRELVRLRCCRLKDGGTAGDGRSSTWAPHAGSFDFSNN